MSISRRCIPRRGEGPKRDQKEIEIFGQICTSLILAETAWNLCCNVVLPKHFYVSILRYTCSILCKSCPLSKFSAKHIFAKIYFGQVLVFCPAKRVECIRFVRKWRFYHLQSCVFRVFSIKTKWRVKKCFFGGSGRVFDKQNQFHQNYEKRKKCKILMQDYTAEVGTSSAERKIFNKVLLASLAVCPRHRSAQFRRFFFLSLF